MADELRAAGKDATPAVLTGFAADTDWRPFHFVDPPPPLRSCHLCGVIPNATFVLECSHAFCKACYEQVLGKDDTCPLDGERFEETEVTRFVFKAEQLFKLSTRCQNWSRGCHFVGNVREAVNHLLEDCVFHVVRCQKCDVDVVRSGMLDHYVEGCRGSRGLATADTRSVEETLTESVVKASGDILSSLETISQNQSSLQDSVNSLKSEVVTTAREFKSLVKLVAEGVSGASRDDVTRASCPSSDTDVALLDVGDLAALEAEARARGEAFRDSDVFVIGGYAAHLIVHVRMCADEPVLWLYLVIHRSESRSPWPFRRRHAAVIERHTRRMRQELSIQDGIEDYLQHHGWTVGLDQCPVSWANIAPVRELESRGFVHGDAISVAVELR